MKKRILFLTVAIFTILTSAVCAADIKFEPEGNGKWIFCNNPETIANENLMNSPDGESAYIMNNPDLKPDTYDFLLCHINNTSTNDGYGGGFDIELDVEMTAKEDCTLTINKSFFETPLDKSFIFGDGTWAKEMNKVSCLNALASYLGVNLCERNGSWLYAAKEYKPKTIEIKRGETVWLGDYTEDYGVIPYQKPSEMMGQIVLEKGVMSFNVVAFKSTGTLHDRTGYNKKAAFGVYDYSRTQKGIASSLPKVNAELEYTIDSTVQDGDYLKNKVYNQYERKGFVTDSWVTHLNPQDDAWSKKTAVENDLLTITYTDDSKLDYYGKSAKRSLRNNVWTWDQFHSDTAWYEGAVNWFGNKDEYYPNYELSPYRNNEGYACSMGNYCVTESYNLKVKNTTDKDRYFNYVSQTISNIAVFVEDEEGKHSGFVKGEGNGDAKDVLASVKIPAKSEKEFSVNVVLPINYVGGLRNSFMISYESKTGKTYEDYAEESPIIEEGPITRGLTAFAVYDKLPQSVRDIVDIGSRHFELVKTDFGYMMRYMDWDGLPYYYTNHWVKLKDMYILDDNYNLQGHYTPEKLTVLALNYDGYYYRQDAEGNRYRTKDGFNWEEYNHRMPLPEIKYNYDTPASWAEKEITRAFEINVAPYDLKDKLDYVMPMTRATFCYVLSSMLRQCDKMPEEIDEDIVFTDTESNTIRRLATAGIISGYTDGSFRPEGKITRQEAATLLHRAKIYSELSDTDFTMNDWDREFENDKLMVMTPDGETLTANEFISESRMYSDFDKIDDWAKPAVLSMGEEKIMQGMADGSFSPETPYTNEQSIATIMRLYDKITEAK